MSVQLKLKQYTAEEISNLTGGTLVEYNGGEKNAQSFVAIDSREAGDGVVFCAIKGERADGNDFILSAIEMGSSVFICGRVPDDAKNCGRPFSAIIVEDTVKALGLLSYNYRSLSKAKFIGVTGSVGKTTTKEFIYSVCSAKYKTHKTQGNYNSLIGLPLTVFGIEPDDEVVVLEMGMSALGEIEFMSNIARPDIAVITTIGTSHLASLGTRENICRAKMEIRAGLSNSGSLILNGDDQYLINASEQLTKRPVFFSQNSPTADYRAVNIRQQEGSIIFDLLASGKAQTNIEIPVLGKHNVSNALVGYIVGALLGMTDAEIRRGLKSFVNVDKRQKIYDIGGLTVIDDCYNASPESMRAAVDVLVSFASKKKARPTALLGDMLELGKDSKMLHDQIGQYAAEAGVEKLFCYGKTADVIAEAAIKNGIRAENVYVCLDSSTPDIMAEMINGAVKNGDILLVKASRGVAAENVIEALRKKKNTK